MPDVNGQGGSKRILQEPHLRYNVGVQELKASFPGFQIKSLVANDGLCTRGGLQNDTLRAHMLSVVSMSGWFEEGIFQRIGRTSASNENDQPTE